MYRSFIFFLFIGLLLSGCSGEDDVAEESRQKAILFAKVKGIPQEVGMPDGWGMCRDFGSRGIASEQDINQFSVWAIHTDIPQGTWDGTAFYMDETVTRTGQVGVWAPSKTYYWPSGYLSFSFFCPAGAVEGDDFASMTCTRGGLTVTDFKCPADNTSTDLLYAPMLADVAYGDQRLIDGRVPVSFRHMLASVGFLVRADGKNYAQDNIKIVLNQITVQYASSQGTFMESGAGATSYNPSLTPWVAADNFRTDYRLLAQEGSQELGQADYAPVDNARPLLMIPQDLTKVSVWVDYTIVKNIDGKTVTVRQHASHDLEGSWEIGKKYEYGLILGLEKIYFSPTVTPWVDIPELELKPTP